MATFEIIRGPGAGKSFRIESQGVAIGSGAGNEIVLDDPAVAAQHVRIVREGDSYLLTDLGSLDGTFINGYRVKQLPLQPGDEIQLGQTVLRYTPNDTTEAEGVAETAGADEAPTEGDDGVLVAAVVDEGLSTADCQLPIADLRSEIGNRKSEMAPARPTPPGAVAEADGGHREQASGHPEPATGRARFARPLTRVRLARPLIKKVTCPNCWHSFAPEAVLFVAKHPELMGDEVAGSNEFRRFLPARFTLKGEALDERGLPTTDVACPRCHLTLPEAALEVQPVFISIVGSPASGKSYFLTTMTWELRQLLPRFSLVFEDADLVANSVIREAEGRLFRNANPNEPTEIPKTQPDDPRLHKVVHIGGVDIRYPVPFQFFLAPTPRHARYADSSRIGRMIVLYDNAGEDCLPKPEEAASASVRHLARSEIIFVVFDPTQEPSFRAQSASQDPQLTGGLRPGSGVGPVEYRQATIINELAVRIRRYHRMPHSKQIDKPLIIIVAKFDIWADLAGISIESEPFLLPGNGLPARLDVERVERTSEALRGFFDRVCPDFVAMAERISRFVRYIPVTSLGTSPTVVQRPGGVPFYGIRPAGIRPKWMTVPLLYCLSQWGPRGILGE